MVTIKEIDNANSISEAKILLTEYGDYMYNELNLSDGKTSFYRSLNNFPGKEYDRPNGAFLIAYANNIPSGCVGLRRFDKDSCEMKRLYVNAKFRGLDIGGKLCEAIIKLAKEYGNKRMMLDTNKEMNAAIELYKKFSFIEIPPYCINENPNPVYLGREL